MTIHFDEKGKFYTDVVAKKTVYSTIQTITNRLEGNLHVKANNRLIDELKISGQFIALTDATIYHPQGEVLIKASFLTVNRDHIIWIVPKDEIDNSPSESGEGS
ncbi:MAG: hypothetical protein MUO67_06780 [Anaerolineales bacterium]|jgi:hypothetical protein|nr:hypothetical protein [Anaerolineales bacterium]